jgi:ABC-type multidrug transport system permease subunit
VEIDETTLQPILEISKFSEEVRQHIFSVIDAPLLLKGRSNLFVKKVMGRRAHWNQFGCGQTILIVITIIILGILFNIIRYFLF